MFIILLALFSFLRQTIHLNAVEPIAFTFQSFYTDSCGQHGDFICWGSAAAGNHGYMDLTPDLNSINHTAVPSKAKDGGRFLYKHPMLAWPASFTTTFVVRISSNPNSTFHGDGMAFIMAEDSGPSPVNSSGLFLGIFNRTTQGGSIRQLAVELDTFMNEFDPNNNHVGINTRSIVSDATADLDSVGADLSQGRCVRVSIKYDGWNKTLQLFAAYEGNPLVNVLNHSIDMETTVPPFVFVGFTASSPGFVDSHQVISWAFTTYPLPHDSLENDRKRHSMSNKALVIAFPVMAGFLGVASCFVLAVGKVKWRKRATKKAKRKDIESRSRVAVNAPKMFTFKQLSKATNNFSKDNLLGVGGFGSVYRGDIPDPPFTIAVKQISDTSTQGEREYFAEICTIGRLRHKNLVQLHGWCHKRQRLLLVYEFMTNGSLDRFIAQGFLDWPTRYKVLTGLASALLYLQEECGNIVIHRDVKPSNVMLDAHYNARLGDFGLARLVENENEITTKLAGTPGYMAPECIYTGKATTDSDVFSFGIVALEVACGRRSICGVENSSLVDQVWELYGKGDLLQGADPRLQGNLEEEEMKRVLVVGLACSHPDPRTRPSMRKVVQIFKNREEPLMELPRSRPPAIYVPLLSPTVSRMAFGSNANTRSAVSEVSTGDTSLQYGR